jgi:hypothetical protein
VLSFMPPDTSSHISAEIAMNKRRTSPFSW